MNFYKHYMGDYGRATGHLSLAEHGAYRCLLDHYYSSESPLPESLQSLYRLCRAQNEQERLAVAVIADLYFPASSDGLRHNSRADQEIAKWQAQAIVNRELGKLGGRPKKTESVSQSVNETEPNNNPLQNPESRIHIQKPETQEQSIVRVPRTSNGHASLFPEFWKAYPSKKGRKLCEEIWKRRKMDEFLPKILDDLSDRFTRDDTWKKGFVPNPSTYLNQNRWEDAI